MKLYYDDLLDQFFIWHNEYGFFESSVCGYSVTFDWPYDVSNTMIGLGDL